MVPSLTVPPTYSPCTEFRRDLETRVAGYFSAAHRSRQGSGCLYLKTAILLIWLGASYVGLVWGATAWWQAVPSGGVAGAGDGRRRVQHPARRQPRRLFAPQAASTEAAALSLNLLGGRRVLLALQAQHRPPQLSQRDAARTTTSASARSRRMSPSTSLVTGSTASSTSTSGASTRCWPSTGSLPGDFRAMIKPGVADTRRAHARAAGTWSVSGSARRAS